MTDFSKLLNPEQCAAATAGDGPLLVLAAAGTGKTRTLVHRVAFLVEQGVPADRILLLTFTNRAAREMIALGDPRELRASSKDEFVRKFFNRGETLADSGAAWQREWGL